jgi:hypothetical protein
VIDVLVPVIFELSACLDLNLRTLKTDLSRDTKRARAVLRNVLLSQGVHAVLGAPQQFSYLWNFSHLQKKCPRKCSPALLYVFHRGLINIFDGTQSSGGYPLTGR